MCSAEVADSPTTAGTFTGGGPALRITCTVDPYDTRLPGLGACETARPRAASAYRLEYCGCTCVRLARASTPPTGSPRSSGTVVFAPAPASKKTARLALASTSMPRTAAKRRRAWARDLPGRGVRGRSLVAVDGRRETFATVAAEAASTVGAVASVPPAADESLSRLLVGPRAPATLAAEPSCCSHTRNAAG